MLVDEEKIRPRIVRNCNIRPAVIIEISQYPTHSFRLGLADTGRIAYVREGPVVVIAVKLGLLALVISRMTVGTISGLALSAPDVGFRSPFNVVRYEQVEPPVFVVIKPACTG